VSPHLCIIALTPDASALGDRAYKVINEVIRVGPEQRAGMLIKRRRNISSLFLSVR
jgi:hypothetical protein